MDYFPGSSGEHTGQKINVFFMIVYLFLIVCNCFKSNFFVLFHPQSWCRNFHTDKECMSERVDVGHVHDTLEIPVCPSGE